MNHRTYCIRKAQNSDSEQLTLIFWNNLKAHPEYISHGEIQMGVASNINTPAIDGEKKWEQYIIEKIADKNAEVFVNEDNFKITGFAVVAIEEDGDMPFGVLCDLLVLPTERSNGLGNALMQTCIDWLTEKNVTEIYLESGKENHAAHLFFEKRGFEIVSHVYKRINNH